MWQHRSTTERLDGIEKFFERLFGSGDHDGRQDADHHIVRYLQQMEKRIMSALSDKLNAAVETLAANIKTIGDNLVVNDAAIQAEIAALKAAVENSDAPAIEAAIAKIGELSTAAAAQADDIKGDTDRLTASLR